MIDHPQVPRFLQVVPNRARDEAGGGIARRGNLEEPDSLRIGHRMAREATTAGCTRCLDTTELPAGTWHATDPTDDGRHLCDRCAAADDPPGYAQLLAWRRMARPTWRTAA